jgi:hypothetical protein
MKKIFLLLILLFFATITSIFAQKKTALTAFSLNRPQNLGIKMGFPIFTVTWMMPSKNAFQKTVQFGAVRLQKDTVALLALVGKRYTFFQYHKLKMYGEGSGGYACYTRLVEQPQSDYTGNNTVSTRQEPTTPKQSGSGAFVSDGAFTKHTIAFNQLIGIQYLIGKSQGKFTTNQGIGLFAEMRLSEFLMLRNAPRTHCYWNVGFSMNFD